MICVPLCGSLNILWHCLSLGLEGKLTFSSPVATADKFFKFSKFADILSEIAIASYFYEEESKTQEDEIIYTRLYGNGEKSQFEWFNFPDLFTTPCLLSCLLCQKSFLLN